MLSKAQKENQARFKAVQAEAKLLRARMPQLSHIEAVSKAWAKFRSKPVAKVGAVKKPVAKNQTSLFNNDKIEKKQTPAQKKKLIEYWSGKKPATKKAVAKKPAIKKDPARQLKVKNYNEEIDKQRVALPVGKRIAKDSGNVYYERRINRSDAKGKLTGMGAKKTMPVSKHKDTKSHNVNIRVMSGTKVKKSIGALPKYHDQHMAEEIMSFADNDYFLYKQQKRPIILNLAKKYQKGSYDLDKSAKLWSYFIDSALKKYHKDFKFKGKWYDIMDMHDRKLLALDYAINVKEEFDHENFDF